MGSSSETLINMVVTSQNEAGEVTLLYQNAIRYKLPRPCPVGVQSKARTEAVMQLLQQATLALMVAVGAIKKPDDVQQPEGTHDPEVFQET